MPTTFRPSRTGEGLSGHLQVLCNQYCQDLALCTRNGNTATTRWKPWHLHEPGWNMSRIWLSSFWAYYGSCRALESIIYMHGRRCCFTFAWLRAAGIRELCGTEIIADKRFNQNVVRFWWRECIAIWKTRMNKIVAYCRITDNALVLNRAELAPLLKAQVKLRTQTCTAQVAYPKFIKWTMCPAGFASELVLRSLNYNMEVPTEAFYGTCFCNSSSSLDKTNVFRRHCKMPTSQAHFFYTLHIVTGEVAIRNKILGKPLLYHEIF